MAATGAGERVTPHEPPVLAAMAGRGQFALDLRRRSAVKAWWRGVRLVFTRPVATLESYFLITAVGLILAALLGIARINSPHATFAGFLVSLALTELIATLDAQRAYEADASMFDIGKRLAERTLDIER